MEFKDYYEILQVHRKASCEIIQKSYKVLALKYHPDRNMDNLKDSEEKMKNINEAYEVLNNMKATNNLAVVIQNLLCKLISYDTKKNIDIPKTPESFSGVFYAKLQQCGRLLLTFVK